MNHKQKNRHQNSSILQFAGILCLIIIVAALGVKLTRPLTININEKQAYGEQRRNSIYDWAIVSSLFAESKEYDREEYNCVNYSLELHEIAKQLGFDTQVVRGCPTSDYSGFNETCHAWLRIIVDFEPQTAEFTDYSDIYPSLEIIEGKI